MTQAFAKQRNRSGRLENSLFAALFLDEMAQLALHRFERVVNDFVERFVRAVVHLLLVTDQLVPWRNRNIDPATERIPFLMRVVWLLDRYVAAIDVVAKFFESRGVVQNQIVDLGGRACLLLKLSQGEQPRARHESWKKRAMAAWAAITGEEERAGGKK